MRPRYCIPVLLAHFQFWSTESQKSMLSVTYRGTHTSILATACSYGTRLPWAASAAVGIPAGNRVKTICNEIVIINYVVVHPTHTKLASNIFDGKYNFKITDYFGSVVEQK